MMNEGRRLDLPSPGPRYSHYAFRYPAKFHPPVVRALLDRHVGPNEVLFDNFCGSGTSLIEAAVSGRRSVGLDVDPVAVLVSHAKTRRYDPSQLQRDAKILTVSLAEIERDEGEYDRRTFDDLSFEEYASAVAADDLWVPKIPRLDHWFRRYVTIDLARILRLIETTDVGEQNRVLFMLAFGGTIRNVSNADPVPVSGLEVTSHMKKKDAEGRRINPIQQYRDSLRRAVDAVTAFSKEIHADWQPHVIPGDATELPPEMSRNIDAVITSPPYHNAVDYYRRHQLEMYWLHLVSDHAQRLELLPKYIGRQRIPAKHALMKGDWKPGPLAERWHDKMLVKDSSRAMDFRHYMISMEKVFAELSKVLRRGAPLILVVGESAWRGEQIPTGSLLSEVARPHFNLQERLWYPIKNRYMSYTRHNGADIGHEHVLVFRES